MKKDAITPFRLTALMFCAYISPMLTLHVLSEENIIAVMTGSAVSTAVQALLFVPVILFFRRFGTDPCEAAMLRSRAAGALLTAAFLLYFLREAFLVIGDFGYYTDYFLPPCVSRMVTPVCLALAGAYLAVQRLGVMGKTASAVFVSLIFAIAVIALSLLSKAELSNLHFAVRDRTSAIMRCARAELSRCEGPVLLSFLLPMMERTESPSKTAARYTLWVFAAAEVIIGFTGMSLGDMLHFSKAPVFTAVSLADGGIIRRYDSFFLILRTMTAVVKLALPIFCAARCISLLRVPLHRFTACVISAAVPLICVFPLLYSYEWESIAYSDRGTAALTVLASVIPSVFLIFARKEKNDARTDIRPQPAQ